MQQAATINNAFINGLIMDQSDNDKIEDDVMQALESLRAILDNDPVSTIKDTDNIPTLNNIVETPTTKRPTKDNTMESLSLFEDTPKARSKHERKAEEQLIFPQVSELDKHHSIDKPEQRQHKTDNSELDFDEFWVLLEPKLKQAAKECFRQLLKQTHKQKKSPN